MSESILEWFRTYEDMLLIGISLFSLVVLLLFIVMWQSSQQAKSRLTHTLSLLEHINPSMGVDNHLTHILELLVSIVPASGYAFYILDNKNDHYSLRAVRHANENSVQLEPSYSNLLPDKKEKYLPPLKLPVHRGTAKLEQIREGEVPLIHVPLGKWGVIRIGPGGRLTRRRRQMLEFFAGVLTPILEIIVGSDKVKMESDVIITSGQALHDVCALALDPEAMLRKLVRMFSVALGVEQAFVLVHQDDRWDLAFASGWSLEKEQMLRRKPEWVLSLLHNLQGRLCMIVSETDPLYQEIPQAFSAGQEGAFAICQFDGLGPEGVLVLRLTKNASEWSDEQSLHASLQALVQDITRLMRIQQQMAPMAAVYADLLKMLARTIDNLNPYTTGYSELVSRYSIIIAQELGLETVEIQNIALAAYVSNIGVLGLSEEIYLKEGKFSELEYEKMKLHAEVGAAIVEMTIGNKRVADCIRYHHERMDGNGYPAGLEADEIPVGARIIAVVQTFLAKINGRKYREPLPFDKALTALQSAAGTQLDPRIVQALIGWFEKKRATPSTVKRSLGPCWEMACAPSALCMTCPAYGQIEHNCWEFERNNCQAHGKSCKTCYVYTETIGRALQTV